MTDLTQLDINVYLQLSNSCYSSMSSSFANDLKYGRKCSESERLNMIILSVLIEILSCYHAGETDNCYTEAEIQELIGNISSLTGIEFKPPGYSYEVPTGYTLTDGVLIPD